MGTSAVFKLQHTVFKIQSDTFTYTVKDFPDLIRSVVSGDTDYICTLVILEEMQFESIVNIGMTADYTYVMIHFSVQRAFNTVF